MSNTSNARGILHAIQLIAANHETGQLEIRSSRSHGSLVFSKGKLVYATLGPLTGFQAVNAAVALRAVEVSFNPLISPPRQGSIAPNERIVLKQFFGIEAADATEEIESVDWNITPHQVVPLDELDEAESGAGVGAEGRSTEGRSSLSEAGFIRNETPEEPLAPKVILETTTHNPAPPPRIISAENHRFPLRRPVAVSLMLLLILAAAAIALIPKLKAHREVASVPPAQSSAIPQSTTPDVQESIPQSTTPDVNESKPDTEREKSPAASVAQQQSQNINSSAPSSTMDTTQRAQSSEPQVQDLTGEWHVINIVDKTAYKTFQNMQIGFRLKIEQKGKDFTARGEKISENGRNLPARSRTPIHVTGSIDGDKVVATFFEDGLMRRTNGRFDWRLQDEHDALSGTFISAAANSSGKSAATRRP